MFSLNSAKSVTKIFLKKIAVFKPAISCVRNQHSTPAAGRPRECLN